MLSAIISIAGTRLLDEEKVFLSKHNPLGVNLFARNIENKSQLKQLIKDIKQALSRDDVIIAIDQEGGRVRRLYEPEFMPISSQYVLGRSEELATKYHAIITSQDLHSVGINMNYSPVLDILYPNTHNVLRSRCFADNKEMIAKLGQIMINTYINNSICPCIKHLPGHGRAVSDPHLGLPVLDCSLKDLSNDFYPFIANNQSPAGMSAHIVIAEVDNKLPVTLSAKAIDKVIRGIIGFDGLLISDAIDMNALKGSIGERAKQAITAGCDVVCYCGGNIDELYNLADNCKTMSDNSLVRLEKINSIISKQEYKQDDISKEYYNLVGNIDEYQEDYDATEVLNIMNKKEKKQC